MPSNDVVKNPSSLNSSKTDLPSRHICPKCGAEKTVSSRPQSGDKLMMRFLPKGPYRCLRCYHRFWKAEPFFASPSRVWTWVFVILALIVFILMQMRSTERSSSNIISSIGTTQDTQATQDADTTVDIVTQPVDGISTSVSENAFIENEFRENDVRENYDNVLRGEPSTPEELQRQIILAKKQAELAKQSNEKRHQLMEKSLSSAENELQSLLKLDISYEIDQWRRAWEAGDSGRYLSFYSEEFKPSGGISVKAWREQRKQRVTRSKKASIVMSDYDVSFDKKNTRSTVSFTQVYKAGSYGDTMRKQLVLLKASQRWKIISENEIKQ